MEQVIYPYLHFADEETKAEKISDLSKVTLVVAQILTERGHSATLPPPQLPVSLQSPLRGSAEPAPQVK